VTDNAINLHTFGDLLRHGFRLTGFCRTCGVHKDIDLAACPADRVYVGARFKCRTCCGRVEITLSPIKASNDVHMSTLAKWRGN
jgi:hypothetical protein